MCAPGCCTIAARNKANRTSSRRSSVSPNGSSHGRAARSAGDGAGQPSRCLPLPPSALPWDVEARLFRPEGGREEPASPGLPAPVGVAPTLGAPGVAAPPALPDAPPEPLLPPARREETPLPKPSSAAAASDHCAKTWSRAACAEVDRYGTCASHDFVCSP